MLLKCVPENCLKANVVLQKTSLEDVLEKETSGGNQESRSVTNNHKMNTEVLCFFLGVLL